MTSLGGYSFGDRVYLRESPDVSLLGLVGTVSLVEQRETSEFTSEVWLTVEIDGNGSHSQKAADWAKDLESQ